jgi:integrase/recombinase XerD
MLEELQRRNYAKTTAQYYIQTVEQFAKYFGKPPDQLNQSHLRTYQTYLLHERKLAPRSVTRRTIFAPIRAICVASLPIESYRYSYPTTAFGYLA